MTSDEIEIMLDIAKESLNKKSLYNTAIVYIADEKDQIIHIDMRTDQIGYVTALSDMDKFIIRKYGTDRINQIYDMLLTDPKAGTQALVDELTKLQSKSSNPHLTSMIEKIKEKYLIEDPNATATLPDQNKDPGKPLGM